MLHDKMQDLKTKLKLAIGFVENSSKDFMTICMINISALKSRWQRATFEWMSPPISANKCLRCSGAIAVLTVAAQDDDSRFAA